MARNSRCGLSSHRIKYLEALLDLDYVICHDGVALMTASEIGDWYRAEMSKVRNSKD
jgi:allantoinase